MDINTLKGDKYHLNNAFSNTTSRFKNEIYSKNNIKNIINEYLIDDYIKYYYEQKKYKIIRECIYSSCENKELFDYVMVKLRRIYNNDMKKAFVDLKLIKVIGYHHCLVYDLKEKVYYSMNKDIIRYLKSICDIPTYNYSIENNMIIRSCQTGDIKYIKFIIDIIDNVNINKIIEVCDIYKNPLHIAYDNDNLHIIKNLLALGVNIDLINDHKNTLLHYAVLHNDIELVKYLIDAGAKPLINAISQRPIDIACSNYKYIEIFKYLMNKSSDDINTKNKYGETLLHIAIYHNCIEMVKYLIEDKGANMNIKTYNSETPLHMACRRNKIEIGKYLIDKGADMNIQNYEDETPLNQAISFDNIELAKYLIDKGASINNNKEATPLHLVCKYFYINIEMVKYLIEDKGADMNIKNNRGETPLHYACNFGDKNIEIVSYLIYKGADINIKNNEDETPLHYACRVRYENIETGKYLIDKGADINFKNKDGETPLHYVCKCGYIEMLKYLIDNGTDMNIKDIDGKTPLHYARICDNIEMVKYLIDKGADVFF